MKAFTSGLGAAVLSLLVAAQAVAEPIVVTAPHASAGASRGAALPTGAVYSSFSSDGHSLYDCCQGWAILGPTNIYGSTQSVAAPFTPATDMHLGQVRLALSFLDGTNAMKVSLLKDANGLPGRLLGELEVDDAAPFGGCCTTRAVKGDGLFLKGGRTYWVAVSAVAGDTNGAWNFNDIALYGPMAFNSIYGWQASWSTLPAFAVFAR